MPTVFISYRRDDSGPFAARLSDRLCEHFGAERVFRDIDNIAVGVKFPELIQQRIDGSDAVLAVIGRRWSSISDDKGQRRLDDPDDWVRVEIRGALQAGKRVIPVLVDGARLPRRDKVPSDIGALFDRNAAEVSDSRFAYDMQRLIGAIEGNESVWQRLRNWLGNPQFQRRASLGASALAALAGAVVLALWFVDPRPLPELQQTSQAQVQAYLVERRRQRRGVEELLADLHRTTAERDRTIKDTDEQLKADLEANNRAAREALRRNDTAAARKRLAELADGTDPASAGAAAFQLGEFALGEAKAREAYGRLNQAARLQPGNAVFHNLAGRAAQEAGDLDAARGHLEAALELRRKAAPADAAALTQSLINLALLHKEARRSAEAEALYLEANELQQAQAKPDEALVALIKNNLAQLYRMAAPDTPALRERIESLLGQALEASRHAHGADSVQTATALNNLAAFHAANGQAGTAQPLYQSSLALREKLLPADHPDIAASLNNLAALHAADGRPQEAEPLYRRALAMQQRSLGAEHRAVAVTLNNLGQTLHRLRRPADAEASYRQALAIQGTATWNDDVALALTRNNLALLYMDGQRLAEAEPMFKDAATTLLAALPVQHEHVKSVVGNYAECLRRLQRDDEAKAWLARLQAAAGEGKEAS
jgi:tetratricopeptide (TPR) repeat protein